MLYSVWGENEQYAAVLSLPPRDKGVVLSPGRSSSSEAPKTDCETALDRLLALLSTIAPFHTPDFHGFTIPARPRYGIPARKTGIP